uniref:Amyloid beta precursor protein binding family A member 2 n=1 Tax=Stegastes partitus TaxID=144197 RepID=A0A3B5AXM6_9TELE
MAAPGPASCPAPHPTESCDLKALPARQRPLRYPKESHDSKPHSCKAQYSSPKSQDAGRSHHPDHHPEADADAEVEVKRYGSQADAEVEDQRPATPSTPEHNHDPDDQDQADFHGGADSLDDDSSSDYINNTSDEEEDYDDGLAEEDEGVTYYIRYCPEDDSYLEGMDCSSQGNCNHGHGHGHGTGHGQGDCTGTGMQLDGSHTDECQEAVEGWTEEGEGEGEEAESEEYCPNEEEDDEGDEEERHGRAYTGDYYAPEDNGNSVRVSPYRSRKVLVVEGETGEEAEEDIDQIVAEIKMSMSMGSLSSGTDQSPEELAQDPAPSDYPHSKPDAVPYPPAHHRHDSRPKSLNLPSIHHNNPELQRGIKVHPRSPEDRQRWAQEQVSNGAEQPRKQQRSDLNVPLENNNVPEVRFPGPCEPEDLIDGIIFAANYLGSTQLLSERNPSKNIRMMQAQEAVSRVKSADGDAQTLTEVDLFISTQRIKVLNADSQETMMDNALRTISYIADIGNIVVLMARRRMPRTASQDCIETTPGAPEAKKQYKMICHVFESEDAQLIAQSIGQAFSVAYQEFLRANGINPEDLSQKEYSDIINTQEMYNDDLIHFSNSENCKELQLEKSKGEILGVVIVESGWGSILPTVILANMMNGGPAARSGKLSIGDQIMSINNTSLVGLPLATCQGIIKGLKNQVQVKMNIVSCPPVTTVLIKRPDLKYQLGFSVQNGIICSLMRGGIAERGGVRVGHRIIEINGQSVVATAHEKIVQALSNSVGEIHMKTMPAAMFRLLTGQETPMYI